MEKSSWTRLCPNCSALLSYNSKSDRNKAERKQKWCRSCATKRVIANPPERVNREDGIERACVRCGEQFKASKYKPNAKFCSAECRIKGSPALGSAKRGDRLRGTGEGKSYTKRGGRHEHRAVMEQVVGRPLGSDEIVHHEDENKRNNDPTNLKIVTRSEHARIHFTKRDPICTEPGCNGAHIALGLCSLHYHRLKRARKREQCLAS